MMQFFYDFIKQNWFGLITFLLGVLVSYIFFKQSLKESVPIYTSKTLKLIGKDNSLIPNDVKIFFKGHEIEQLSKSVIVIWNHGKKTLYESDIVKDDSLKIVFDDSVEILSTDVTKVTRQANKFSVDHLSKNEVSITFEYLDANDGATIEILHTGYNNIPVISGTIIGIPKGVIKFDKNRKLLGIEIERLVEYISVASLITAFTFLVSLLSDFKAFTITKTLVLVISILIILILTYRAKKKPFPKQLNVENIDL